MNTQNCSTQALLSLLVGKRIASQFSKIPLSVLRAFCLSELREQESS